MMNNVLLIVAMAVILGGTLLVLALLGLEGDLRLACLRTYNTWLADQAHQRGLSVGLTIELPDDYRIAPGVGATLREGGDGLLLEGTGWEALDKVSDEELEVI